jgi:two-component system sensor histidine kinase/response regulator
MTGHSFQSVELRGAALSSLSAAPSDRSRAIPVVIASVLLFAALVPFAKTPLTPVPAFIASYQSALVASDLITAMLLFGQLRYFRSRALLALANAYLLSALAAVAHALTFPGLLAPGGLLGAGPQSTAWLYMFWHAAFPVFVIAYALLSGEIRHPRAVAISIGTTGLSGHRSTVIATSGHALLPPIMSGNQYTPLMTGVIGSVWASSAVALVALWLRRPRTVLDIWLMVVMVAWICE